MGHAAPLVLAGDDLEVVLLPEHGARLHRVRAFGIDLLRTPDDVAAHETDPFFWGGYVMAPWCNRIAPGPVRVAGRTVDLAPNFPDGTAIHGLVATRPWQPDGDGTLRVVVDGGGDGWPWTFEVSLLATVEGRTLTLAYALANRSDAPMPAGLGLHPWFRRPLELRVPASEVYAANSGSPADPEPVNDGLDLRALRAPPPGLDVTFAAVDPPVIDLAWPDAGIRATLASATGGGTFVAVATPPDIGAIAVEAQTHGPDGLRRLLQGEGDALRMLEPGAAMALELRLTVERDGAYR
jgi:aldose 1-epimerase